MIEEFIREYVTDACGLGKYVLDIGTGSANMATAIARAGIRCITVEKSIKAYEEAKIAINRHCIETNLKRECKDIGIEYKSELFF